MNDKHRAAGRSGVGAVMGSKNLKAVVVKGKGRIPLADPDRFKTFNKQILDTFKARHQGNPLGPDGQRYRRRGDGDPEFRCAAHQELAAGHLRRLGENSRVRN